jgi:hypothetical protein
MPALNITLLLVAIATVESGNNDAAIGAHGERGRYQMKADVWNQHAASVGAGDFTTNAHKPLIAETVAEKHAIWLARELERAGVPVTPETIAQAWNMGANGAIKHRLLTATPTDYALRVAALYAEAMASQPSAIPAHLRDVLPPPPKLNP